MAWIQSTQRPTYARNTQKQMMGQAGISPLTYFLSYRAHMDSILSLSQNAVFSTSKISTLLYENRNKRD